MIPSKPKRRKAREFWAIKPNPGSPGIVYAHRSAAILYSVDVGSPMIHVREVLPRKRTMKSKGR